jgi:hypothetical protein
MGGAEVSIGDRWKGSGHGLDRSRAASSGLRQVGVATEDAATQIVTTP